jgi:transcriptional regulator with XRE-family HTH domain
MVTSDRSLISQFLVLLRKRQGLTVEHVASRLDMSIVRYVKVEESPESAPVMDLYKIFETLKISNNEYFDLTILIQHLQSMPPENLVSENSPSPKQNSLLTGRNILDLFASKNLNLAKI